MEQKLHWRPVDKVFCPGMALHTWQRQLGTNWETVGQLPHTANGEHNPQRCTVSPLGKPPPSALGQGKGVSYRAEEMFPV